MKHPLNDNPIIQGYIEGNNFGRYINMDFEILNPGDIHYKIIIEDCHLATPIASHGGVIASVMDSTLGISALSLVCEEDQIVSTVNMNVNFLAPVRKGDVLNAFSRLLSKGKKLIVTEAEIYNQNDKIVAKGMGTFNIYPSHKAGYKYSS